MSGVRTLLSSVIVAVLLAGCSGAEPRRAVEPSLSPPPVDFVNGGVCVPDATNRLHPKAGCVTTAHGTGGALSVYAILDRESRPRLWRINLDTGSVVSDTELEAGNPFSYPRALSAVDVNGDGEEEWLIKAVDLAGHGTNWQRLQLFLQTEDDDLEVLTVDGEPFYVNVGGISRMGEGGRCDGRTFVLLRTEAENRQNTVWSFSERRYEIRGSEAVFVDRRDGELQLSDYNDPQLDPYYRITCGDFLYP